MIAKITKAYIRHYSDNGQTTAYVEWVDNRGRSGRTEGVVRHKCPCCGTRKKNALGSHMSALFERAKREGVTPTQETW